MTLFSLAWVNHGAQTTPAHASKIDLVFSISLTFAVVLCIAVQFYRVRKFLAK